MTDVQDDQCVAAYNKRASNLLRLIEADSGARDGTQFILIPWLFCFRWLFFFCICV